MQPQLVIWKRFIRSLWGWTGVDRRNLLAASAGHLEEVY